MYSQPETRTRRLAGRLRKVARGAAEGLGEVPQLTGMTRGLPMMATLVRVPPPAAGPILDNSNGGAFNTSAAGPVSRLLLTWTRLSHFYLTLVRLLSSGSFTFFSTACFPSQLPACLLYCFTACLFILLGPNVLGMATAI